MAKWVAANPTGDIGDWKEAPRNVKRDHQGAINAILQKAKSAPQAVFEYPERKAKGPKWTEKDTQKFEQLKSAREKKGIELKIHPSLLGTNAAFEGIVSGAPKNILELEKLNILMPWQRELIADEVLKIMNPPV